MSYRAREHYRDAEVAAVYDRDRFASIKGRYVNHREMALIRQAIQRAGAPAAASILDVPCGTGRLARTLAAAGYTVTGIDVSEAMLDVASARVARMPPEARPKLDLGDAEALSFADASFDVVVSLRLLGHLPPVSRARVLRELRRVSRGPVIVAFYHRHCLQQLWRAHGLRESSWFPIGLHDIDAELLAAGLRRTHRAFLLRGVSETVIVLALPSMT